MHAVCLLVVSVSVNIRDWSQPLEAGAGLLSFSYSTRDSSQGSFFYVLRSWMERKGCIPGP
jgi:hypothetical protein